VLILFQVHTVWAASDGAFIKNLERAVEKVEATPKDVERSEATEQLVDVTCEAGFGSSEKVPTALITRIIAFLNMDYDNTRLWVAAALGCLGPQAKAAAPKLLEILPEVSCVRASLNSAATIGIALERMGVEIPPYECTNSSDPSRSR
jgi:hypothetical protein